MSAGARPRARHVTDGPPRPSVPPLVWAAGGLWAGAAVGVEASLRAAQGSAWAPGAACAVGGALAAAAMAARAVRRVPDTWVIAACACALGIALAGLQGAGGAAAVRRAEDVGAGSWRGVVAGDARATATGTRLLVRLTGGVADATMVSVAVPEGADAPEYGRTVAFDALLAAPDLTQPWAVAAWRRGQLLGARPWRLSIGPWAPGLLGLVSRWRAGALTALRGMPGEGPGVVGAMAFGAREEAGGSRAEEAARAVGVAWALSASGLHLGVAVLLADALAARWGAGRGSRAAVAAVAAVAFWMACGMRIALARGCLVALAGVAARVYGRRRDALAATGAAVLLLVGVDPRAAGDAGLALGVTAVVAMAALGGLAREWVRPLVGRSASWSMGASVAACVATAPISAALFGSVGVAGPALLLVTAPFVQAAVGLALAGATLLPAWPDAGRVLLGAACHAARVACAVWEWAASVPGASIPAADVPPAAWALWAAAVAALWLGWPLPARAARVRLVAGLVALACASAWFVVPRGAGPRITVLDVGQGDAVLVRDGAATLLVDVGPDPVAMRRALARAGVRALDGLVLTHAHDDHTGGLAALRGTVRPAWIGVPGVRDRAVAALGRDCADRAGRVVPLSAGQRWRVGGTSVRVLWPRAGEQGLDANDTSVILLVEREGVRGLLLGDAEERAQRGALAAFGGPVGLLKASHHGSANGIVEGALESWRPRIVAISVGAHNRFGHPTRAALDAFARIGARVARTDRDGDLEFGLPARARVRQSSDPSRPRPAVAGIRGTKDPWPAPTSPISSPSTSSTAPRSCCSSGPCGVCATVWRPWPTWTSTWRASTARAPPPTTSSTPPTPCRS